MKIVLEFTESEVAQIMVESTMFKTVVFRTLVNQHQILSKIPPQDTDEVVLIRKLSNRIKNALSFDGRAECIRNVRNWAVDNRDSISPKKYEELYSLQGARDFVNRLIDENVVVKSDH
jgi:hypothetical protein